MNGDGAWNHEALVISGIYVMSVYVLCWLFDVLKKFQLGSMFIVTEML